MKLQQYILIVFALFSLALQSLSAIDLGKYEIQKESYVWIEGSSTVNNYKCTCDKIYGEGVLDSSKKGVIVSGVDKEIYLNASFSVPVKYMNCGNTNMNEDMYEALKTKTHSRINYEIKRVTFNRDGLQDGKAYAASTLGYLTVAGVKREIEMVVKVTKINGNRYRLEGNTEILMSDYNITPPTALFGLIQADNKVKFFFDIKVSR